MTKSVHTFRENTPIDETIAVGFGHDEGGHGAVMAIPVARYKRDEIAVGRNLRESRKALGLTMGDAARITGMTVTQISELELGAASVDAFLYLDELRTSRTYGKV